MNRNEAINKLTEAGRDAFGISPIELDGWSYDYDARHYWNPREMFITENDVFATESLQSRIETLFDMKFETEEKLLETIGSLWGSGISPDYESVSEVYGGSLKNELDLAEAVYSLISYRKEYHEIKEIICKAGVPQLGELVTDSIRRLVESEQNAGAEFKSREFESGLINCLKKISLLVGRKFAVDVGYEQLPDVVAEALAGPQKTYWDGVEPLRVGHIVATGEVVSVSEIEAVLEQPTGYAIYSRNSLKPHPFAKYSDEQREFLQAQVEAGVIKLC